MAVRVYGSDHPPPHFHVIGPEGEALIDLTTLVVEQGKVPRSVRDEVLDWVRDNRILIVEEWNRLNPRFPKT